MAVYICGKCGWVMGYMGPPKKCKICDIDLILTDLDDGTYVNMSDFQTDQFRESFQSKEKYDKIAWEGRIEYDNNRISGLREEASVKLVQATCPYCNSKNTQKISGTEKAIDTGLFGLFGTKRFYQWHCNSCNSDF